MWLYGDLSFSFFPQFLKRFSSYHEYCWKEEDNLEFSRRQMENNLHFSTYVQVQWSSSNIHIQPVHAFYTSEDQRIALPH